MANSSIKSDWLDIQDVLRSKINANKNYEQIREYEEVKVDDLGNYSEYRNAAHAFIWAKNTNKIFNNSAKDHKAAILMNMRFDGCIGFAGGYIDETDDSIVDGLNRELKEEIYLDEKYYLANDDLLFIHACKSRKILLHFYAKMVNYEDFLNIEHTCLHSSDWGVEVLGILRPPLYKMEQNSDRGFERFLKNEFIGNSLLQLFQSLIYLEIFHKNELLSFIQ